MWDLIPSGRLCWHPYCPNAASPWKPPVMRPRRAKDSSVHHYAAHSVTTDGNFPARKEGCESSVVRHMVNVITEMRKGPDSTHAPSQPGTEPPVTKQGVSCPLAFTWATTMTDVGPASLTHVLQ